MSSCSTNTHSDQMEDDSGIDTCSLGMLIIDEIHFPAPRPPVTNVLGGAGTYCAVGARLFSPPPLSRSVGWVVDRGSDFPSELDGVIESWETGCLIRTDTTRLTTRGWNEYGENEHRAFRYQTPKLRLHENVLTPQLLGSKSFHLICSPLRCVELVTGIKSRRKSLLPTLSDPIFIWEPVPDVCTPERLLEFKAAVAMVSVLSPNHGELASFFGGTGQKGNEVDREQIMSFSETCLDYNPGVAVVVRCGKEGCVVRCRTATKWLPAYHTNQERVVDPTGGGNTFLGGLAAALSRNKDIQTAALWGTIAASFAIEQIGMPRLQKTADGELWNGDSVQYRLEAFVQGLN